MTVPQAFDSLIAKLIVTGASREEALQRSRRALAEFEIDGMPTLLPFHRAVVTDPAFTSSPFTVHTRWIETEFDGGLQPYSGAVESPADGQDAAGAAAAARERITVEVGGKRLEVVIPAGLGAGVHASPGAAGAPGGRGGPFGPGGPGGAGQSARSPAGRSRRRRSGGDSSADGGGTGGGAGGAAGGDALISPMQGTIVKIVAAEGQHVSAGETVVVLEAMKMEQPLTAHKDGTVTGLAVEVGQTVPSGEVIAQLKD
jgi:acetyl-CoA/propionyl-CoA carboxylase, biotin carboxylase, biotin carboxyl carrier protein